MCGRVHGIMAWNGLLFWLFPGCAGALWAASKVESSPRIPALPAKVDVGGKLQ